MPLFAEDDYTICRGPASDKRYIWYATIAALHDQLTTGFVLAEHAASPFPANLTKDILSIVQKPE
jgi:hypothetical protein